MTTPIATAYDAIVVGSGISGGWAAKELCEKGLKTLVLERGRNVEHIKDYPTANLMPWQLPHRGALPLQMRRDNPLISKAAGYGEDTGHFFVKDADHPYVQEKPFDWIRGYQGRRQVAHLGTRLPALEPPRVRRTTLVISHGDSAWQLVRGTRVPLSSTRAAMLRRTIYSTMRAIELEGTLQHIPPR